jgi:hypothetical protein
MAPEGGGSAGAPAPGPAPAPGGAPSPSPAPGPAPAPAPAGHGISWLPQDADAELVGHVQNKGWQSAADAAKAHREAERLIGADRAGRTVVIPTDENDAPGWQKVYERLGRPANAGDYKLPTADGGDPAFTKAAAEKFHELGIPLKTGQKLAAWFDQTIGAAMQQNTAAEAARHAEEVAQLDRDWGAEKPMRQELARRAAQTLGMTGEQVDALQKVAGFSGVMKMFAKVGDMLREHGAEGLANVGGFGMTPEGAKAKRTQLLADADWRKRAMAPGSAEWAEMKRLDGIIAGTGS